MGATSKYLLAEQVQDMLNGAESASRVEMSVIIKTLEQLINKRLQVNFFNVLSPYGETIPDGLLVATYEKIPVEKYKGKWSRAYLPITPIGLPRGMGVHFVGPHISNLYLDDMQLTATPVSPYRINLTWTLVEGATNYYLVRATDEAFTENLTNLFSGNALVFSDLPLQPNTRYFYQVRAEAAGYNDSNWAIANAVTLSVSTPQLQAPNFKTNIVTRNSILCEWDAILNAERYVVEKADDADFLTNVRVIYFGTGLTFLDTGLLPNTIYYYRAKAVASGYIDSNYSTNSNTTLAQGIFDNTFDHTFN